MRKLPCNFFAWEKSWGSFLTFWFNCVYPRKGFVWRPVRRRCACAVTMILKWPTRVDHNYISLNNFQRKTGTGFHNSLKHCKIPRCCEGPDSLTDSAIKWWNIPRAQWKWYKVEFFLQSLVFEEEVWWSHSMDFNWSYTFQFNSIICIHSFEKKNREYKVNLFLCQNLVSYFLHLQVRGHFDQLGQ